MRSGTMLSEEVEGTMAIDSGVSLRILGRAAGILQWLLRATSSKVTADTG